MKYYVYIMECADGTLYTGVTTDVGRRTVEHNTSNQLGAKYTRTRRPVKLVYQKRYASRSTAMQEECRIKKLSREKKMTLVSSDVL